MGKNIKGGNKHKKYAKEKEQVIKLNLYDLDKTDDQEFAFVSKTLGNKRFELKCYDKKTRVGLVRSSKRQTSKRNNWISPNSIVLIAKRTFMKSDDKCDIIKLYNSDEVAFLESQKKIHSNFIKTGSVIKKSINEVDTFSFTRDVKELSKKKKARNYEDVYDSSSEEEEIDYIDAI